jgi:hypothetical protein
MNWPHAYQHRCRRCELTFEVPMDPLTSRPCDEGMICPRCGEPIASFRELDGRPVWLSYSLMSDHSVPSMGAKAQRDSARRAEPKGGRYA